MTQSRKEFGDGFDFNELAVEYNVPLIKQLEKLPKCDIIYSVQYHEILKEKHINQAKKGALNLHMAPLPEYRGSNQFSYAIIDGKVEFGTTIHVMDTQIDHGDIIFEKRFPIPENLWIDELYQLTVQHSVALFQSTLNSVIHEKWVLKKQKSLISKLGTSLHYRKEIQDLKKIDLNWPIQKIEKHIRATYMPGFEPPYCIIDDKKIYFSRKS